MKQHFDSMSHDVSELMKALEEKGINAEFLQNDSRPLDDDFFSRTTKSFKRVAVALSEIRGEEKNEK